MKFKMKHKAYKTLPLKRVRDKQPPPNVKARTYKVADTAALITFTTQAWAKLTTLLMLSDKEVAWRGVVDRIERGVYLVTDIVLYPQIVTSATVNTNEAKFNQWLMTQALSDPELFAKLKMQGHSHVNMSAFASDTDKATQEELLEFVPMPEDDGYTEDNGYYIFIIANKRLDFYIRIIDGGYEYLYGNIEVQASEDNLYDDIFDEIINEMELNVEGSRRVVHCEWLKNIYDSTPTTTTTLYGDEFDYCYLDDMYYEEGEDNNYGYE